MYCPKCGNNIADESTQYCPVCGYELSISSAKTIKTAAL